MTAFTMPVFLVVLVFTSIMSIAAVAWIAHLLRGFRDDHRFRDEASEMLDVLIAELQAAGPRRLPLIVSQDFWYFIKRKRVYSLIISPKDGELYHFVREEGGGWWIGLKRGEREVMFPFGHCSRSDWLTRRMAVICGIIGTPDAKEAAHGR